MTDVLSAVHIAELEDAINARFDKMIVEAERTGNKDAVAACKFNRDIQVAVARTMRDYPNENLFDTGMRVAGGMAAGVAQLVAAAHSEVRDSAALDVVAEIAGNAMSLLREVREREQNGTTSADERGIVVESYDGMAKRH